LVTASADHVARIWRLDTGALEHSLDGHRAPLTSAAFSRDGSRVVTTSANLVVSPPEAEDGILREFDPSARVWDAGTARLLMVLQQYVEGVQSAAFGTDARSVVTAGDSEIRVWRQDGRSSGRRPDDALVALHQASDTSPDGTRVIDGEVVRDARTRTALLTLDTPSGEAPAYAGFSSDGRLLAGVFSAGIRVWDAASGAVRDDVAFNEMGDVSRAVIAPSGRRVAVLHHYRDIRLFDLDSGRTVDLAGQSAAWSPDSARLATVLDRDRSASIWSVESGGRDFEIRGGPDGFTDAQFSADGLLVLTTGFDGWVRVWDSSTGAEFDSFVPDPPGAASAAFTTDGQVIVGERVHPIAFDALLRLAQSRLSRALLVSSAR
jgi:WD40 repeat protein